MRTLWSQIERFNRMYGLPCPDTIVPPSLDDVHRSYNLLKEEVNELPDVDYLGDPINRTVAYADCLADVVVYCLTEARRQGIDLPAVIDAVMRSNWTKLDANGQPIYDSRGKVLKGPNYKAPEAEIESTLFPKVPSIDTDK